MCHLLDDFIVRVILTSSIFAVLVDWRYSFNVSSSLKLNQIIPPSSPLINNTSMIGVSIHQSYREQTLELLVSNACVLLL